ncbi:MAG: Na/Pi symporter, partial [Sulfurimicrobium sp.]|nr:Na/Pi symporter [Sulfurimicrobium sp.]
RRGALGQALAGFGVLFLGIDMMKEAFSGMSADFKLPEGEGVGDTLVQVLIGIALTVLMQSSSASLTIALTAAQGGLLTAQGAAAMVIGANIGTTVTALIASIGATPNAKRAAAAHILFNILTGGVALLLLPWLVPAIGAAGDALELGSAPAAKLALFHTAFNLLGVMLIWPIADRMTRFLEERFRAAEEDEARPRYLDTNVAAVPALALDALEREVRRMGGIALRMMREALAGADGSKLAVDQQIVARLNQAVADFISHINRAGMSPDSARRLPHILRVARYYETVAELSAEVASAKHEIQPLPQIEADSAFLDQVKRMLERIDPEEKLADGGDIASGVQSMEGDYQILKAELLEEGAQGRLPVADMDARLRAASAIRRVVQQAAKAVRLLGAEASASGADQSSLRATQSES